MLYRIIVKNISTKHTIISLIICVLNHFLVPLYTQRTEKQAGNTIRNQSRISIQITPLTARNPARRSDPTQPTHFFVKTKITALLKQLLMPRGTGRRVSACEMKNSSRILYRVGTRFSGFAISNRVSYPFRWMERQWGWLERMRHDNYSIPTTELIAVSKIACTS